MKRSAIGKRFKSSLLNIRLFSHINKYICLIGSPKNGPLAIYFYFFFIRIVYVYRYTRMSFIFIYVQWLHQINYTNIIIQWKLCFYYEFLYFSCYAQFSHTFFP